MQNQYNYFSKTDNLDKIICKNKFDNYGIIEWYENDDEDKRYRLKLKKLPTGYFQEWTYISKEDHKSISPEETSEVLNDLKNYKMITKIKYVFKEDHKIIIDEFLSPFGHKINDGLGNELKYLLKIEEKEKKILDFDKEMEKFGFSLKELEEVDKNDKSFNNKNLAAKFESEESTLDIIEYVKNRLKGDITLVMPIGKAIESKFKKYLYPDEGIKIKNENFYKHMKEHRINKFNYLSKDNESLVNDLSPEIGTLKKLINKGYNIKSVIAFIPKPYIIEDTKNKENKELNNIINLYNGDNWRDKEVSYSFLGNKIFFQEWFGIKEENIEAIPLKYDSKDENSIKNSFKEIWKKLDKLNFSKDDFENNKPIENDNYIIDIAPGLKYIGVIFALYAMFNNKEFYYKQEYQKSLSKFSSFGIDWDYNFIDEFSSIANALNFEDENKSIDIKDFLSLPENFKNIFTQIDGKIKSFYPIKEIIKNYQDKRDMPFGYGDGFLQIFNSKEQVDIMKKMRNYIETMTKQKWSKQWIGDLIPETVEHSQRHSKRLLDFTVNLLNVIGEENFLPKDIINKTYKNTDIKYKYIFYFILAVSINIHDLGHTYYKYKLEDKELYLNNYPSIIRDLHNELTVQLIKEGKESQGIFNILSSDESQSNENMDLKDIFKEDKNEIVEAIKLVCKYHRGYLPIDSEKKAGEKKFVDFFNLDTTSLEDILCPNNSTIKDKTLKNIVIHAARWLKFIDSTDVQADRIITDSYHLARQRRTKFEIITLIDQYQNLYEKNKNLNIIKELVEKIDTENINKNNYKNFEKIEKYAKYIENKVYYDLGYNLGKPYTKFNNPELELLDLIAFKAIQFPHFEKHKSVAAIYPTWLKWDKNNNDLVLHLKLIPNVIGDQNLKKDNPVIGKIKKDIENELKEANIKINNKKLSLKFS